MQLVAVAIGRVRDVDIHGAQVRTAYLKTRLDRPCFIGPGGPEGNETAVHPDTVYAIAEEHYTWWTQRLGVDRSCWDYGYFAENLTIRGLSETRLRIGDIVQVGAEVRLVVTGPRIPCFKVAWRMGQPERFVSDFAASGRTGVYFAVVQAGIVRAGDAVEVIHSEPTHPTVSEIGACVRGEREVTEEELAAILALPTLSKTSALLLSGVYFRMRDRPDTARDWRGWRPFVVARRTREAEGIDSFELRPADAQPLARFAAGQFVSVRLRHGDREFVRPWSLSAYARDPECYRITVKREDHGGASAALHDEVRVGTQLELRPPSGDFRLDRTRVMPVVLVAAGIGITPLLAMAHAHLDRGQDAAPVRLIHCVRHGQVHPLRAEIEALVRQHPRFSAYFVYSRPTEQDLTGSRCHARGRLSPERLIGMLQDLSIEFAGKTIPVPWYETDVYLCGPPAFIEGLRAGLLESGARSERLRIEYFQPDRLSGWGERIAESAVTFKRSARSLMWRSSAGQTLLELARAAGLDLPSSCRSGYCQTCQCRILAGEVQYDFAPLGAPPPGFVLLCCARPGSSVLTLDA